MDADHPGRGTAANPANRFERLRYEAEIDAAPAEGPAATTEFFVDRSQSILVRNESPDVGFAVGLNPYRGCEHGCIYCYARPFHEFLGFSAGLDFETRILVKRDAPELLRKELSRSSWRPEPIGMSGVTDCYQPAERWFRLTRGCLEVLADFRQPVVIVTKNRLVTRDLDLLLSLTRHQAAVVLISVTTLDGDLSQKLEPRATQPTGRLAAIRELAAAGIPVGVMAAPVIPGLTDHEIPGILEAARTAGAAFAGMTMLRLPHGVSDLFVSWLNLHFPDRRDKVLGRIRELRGGDLTDYRFGKRMTGEGYWAEMIRQMFRMHRQRLGFAPRPPNLSVAAFRRPGVAVQLSLFD